MKGLAFSPKKVFLGPKARLGHLAGQVQLYGLVKELEVNTAPYLPATIPYELRYPTAVGVSGDVKVHGNAGIDEDAHIWP